MGPSPMVDETGQSPEPQSPGQPSPGDLGRASEVVGGQVKEIVGGVSAGDRCDQGLSMASDGVGVVTDVLGVANVGGWGQECRVGRGQG